MIHLVKSDSLPIDYLEKRGVSIEYTVYSRKKTSTRANDIDFETFSFYAECKRNFEKQEKGT